MAGITRFFKLTPEQSDGFRSVLVPDGDNLPLDLFKNSKEIYRDDEMVIVHVLLDNNSLADIEAALEDGVDILSIDGVKALGIEAQYCGMEYSSRPLAGLFWFHPGLKGTKVVGQDDGNDIIVDKVLRHTWE